MLHRGFCAALLLLPHLRLPHGSGLPRGPEQLDNNSTDRGLTWQQQSQRLKRKQVTFSLLAPVGPVLVILIYLLQAHGGEFTIAAKQSLCLPWQGGEIYPAYSAREGAWVLFEFERSGNTLLFHFLLSQLLASVPSRPFWNHSRPLSQCFSWKAKQFQYDFRPGFFSLHLSQHQYGGRSPCQRSSPEAVLIQRLGSCQRKQRGEKQQKVAPCSSSEKHVTAEQHIAPRHVFSPFSTQQQKL